MVATGQACHRRFNDPINDAIRRHWEQIADRCFDRAYLAVLRQVTPKPAAGTAADGLLPLSKGTKPTNLVAFGG